MISNLGIVVMPLIIVALGLVLAAVVGGAQKDSIEAEALDWGGNLWPQLGATINTGLKLQRDLITFTGAAIVALLALSIDWVAAVAEKFLRPQGMS